MALGWTSSTHNFACSKLDTQSMLICICRSVVSVGDSDRTGKTAHSDHKHGVVCTVIKKGVRQLLDSPHQVVLCGAHRVHERKMRALQSLHHRHAQTGELPEMYARERDSLRK